MTRTPFIWNRRSLPRACGKAELVILGLPEQQACAAAPALVEALSVRLPPYGWRDKRRRGRYPTSRRVQYGGRRAAMRRASRKGGLA